MAFLNMAGIRLIDAVELAALAGRERIEPLLDEHRSSRSPGVTPPAPAVVLSQYLEANFATQEP
jgi:hypothetical protein